MGNIADRDTAYIWLRQTAELTLGDQRRTVEIAVPVRPGATPEEISRLLDEAESGMERLAERMDRRVAALLGASPAPIAPPAPTVPPATSARPAAPVRPANGIAERPPTVPRPAPSPARSAAPPVAPPASPPPASAPTGGPMSRAEFLVQARGLGQSPRQAMDRLGVRTLEGLNYAEALEQIKRQLLREGTQSPPDTAPTAPEPSYADEPVRATNGATREAPESASAHGPVSYFDEEDDYDVSFELPEDGTESDLTLERGEAEAESAARGERDDLAAPTASDALDLDDVPDFAEPRPPVRAAPAARPRAVPPAATEEPAAASRPTLPTSHQALAQRARAHDLLARLRDYRSGGPAGSDQMTPFTNVVIQQLGEQKVESLTDQVWGITPTQLSAAQMRALIQWGKTDAFATEVVAVLDLLASERETAAPAEPKGPASRPGRTTSRTAERGAGSTR